MGSPPNAYYHWASILSLVIQYPIKITFPFTINKFFKIEETIGIDETWGKCISNGNQNHYTNNLKIMCQTE